MQGIPVVNTTPTDYRNWQLVFRGHCEDLLDFEDQLCTCLGVVGPVKVTSEEVDKLEVWAEWLPDLEDLLLELLQRWSDSVWLETNNRLEEGQQYDT